MIYLVLIIAIIWVALSWYLLGFRLGGRSTEERLIDVRRESAEAQQEIRRLSAEAFAQLADELGRRRRLP